MKRLLIGLLATVLLVVILPARATAATHHLGATFMFADPSATTGLPCGRVGHVNIEKTTRGWSLDLMYQTNQHYDPQTGQCRFDSGWAAGYFEQQNLPAGAVNMNPGLRRAELNVTLSAFDFSGDHDIGRNTLLPIHFTWNATSARVRHPDGTVTRAATVNGTIMTCGDSADYCEPGGGCSAAPPCTRTDMHAVATFVGVKGVLQGS